MNYKKYLPHVSALVILIITSLVYFSPILGGKVLPQSDMVQFPGMAKAIQDNEKVTGHKGEWSPNLFSGMPSYQIEYDRNGNIFDSLTNVLNLGDKTHSLGVFFLLALGFYVFMICMGVNPWLSLFAGLMYALGSYNIIIISVGHITKAWAMAMIAPVLGGMILTFKKKYLAGFLVFTVSLGLQLTFNHIQITYYTLITAIILVVSQFIFSVKDKQIAIFGKSMGVLAIGAILAVMPLCGHFLVNNNYVKHTMRGGSELTIHPQGAKQDVNKDGLDINYAFNWSYGKGETMTLLIPDYMGGGAADTRLHSQDSKQLQNRMQALQSTQPIEKDPQRVQQLANSYLNSTYYGTQPFTAGEVYFGAIVMFLAFMGFFVLDNKWRWWLLAATIISIILSWGSNFMSFNAWLFNHLPLYNKFRTPSMALIIANVTLCIAGIMGLKYFLECENEKKRKISLYVSAIVVGGICLLAWIVPTMFSDFTSPKDDIFAKNLGNDFIAALQDDRIAMFKADAMRSFLFIAFSFVTLLLYHIGKLKNQVVVIIVIGLLSVIDLWGVAKRFINQDSFRSKYETEIVATNAMNSIMETPEKQNIPHYRVYNLASNVFNDASTSYFMPSIGGYSAVKLQRYQDLIDFYLTNSSYKQKDIEDTALLRTNQMRQLFFQYKDNPNFPMPNFGVLNMLDTRYIILSDDAVLENTEACGAAWFVNQTKFVNNADEEILALDNFDPKQTAIINKQYKNLADGVTADIDTAATIQLIKGNDVGHLTYKTNSKTDRIAVFSEIFYKDSWHAFIDGKEVDYFCADYVLRGLKVPAGSHTIEFKCYSNTLKTGNIIAYIGSVVIILCFAGAIFVYYRKRKNNKNDKDKTSTDNTNDKKTISDK